MTDTNAPNVDSSGQKLPPGKAPRKGLVIPLITSLVINRLLTAALAGRPTIAPPPTPSPRHLAWFRPA